MGDRKKSGDGPALKVAKKISRQLKTLNKIVLLRITTETTTIND